LPKVGDCFPVVGRTITHLGDGFPEVGERVLLVGDELGEVVDLRNTVVILHGHPAKDGCCYEILSNQPD